MQKKGSTLVELRFFKDPHVLKLTVVLLLHRQ